MIWLTALWCVAGLLTGALHILLLWRGAQPPFRGIAAGLLRLLGVAFLLGGAAWMGQLLPAACGWGGGFAVAAVGVYVWRAL
jgi:hypothetical protein